MRNLGRSREVQRQIKLQGQGLMVLGDWVSRNKQQLQQGLRQSRTSEPVVMTDCSDWPKHKDKWGRVESKNSSESVRNKSIQSSPASPRASLAECFQRKLDELCSRYSALSTS